MANNPANSNPFLALGRNKFNLNFRVQGQIRDTKKTHPYIAQIDAKSIHADGSSEYLHGGVQQLAFSPSPVWFGVEFENHPLHE